MEVPSFSCHITLLGCFVGSTSGLEVASLPCHSTPLYFFGGVGWNPWRLLGVKFDTVSSQDSSHQTGSGSHPRMQDTGEMLLHHNSCHLLVKELPWVAEFGQFLDWKLHNSLTLQIHCIVLVEGGETLEVYPWSIVIYVGPRGIWVFRLWRYIQENSCLWV